MSSSKHFLVLILMDSESQCGWKNKSGQSSYQLSTHGYELEIANGAFLSKNLSP